MGSYGIAAAIAQIAFWIVLVVGLAFGELRWPAAALFVVLWIAGYLGLPRLFGSGDLLMTSYVAVLDIALVFLVFKRDVRLT
jgi:hypothetical protein